MFFHFSVFLYSLFFLAGLEIVGADWLSNFWNNLFANHGVFLTFAILAMFGYVFQVARKLSHKIEMTLIPLLFAGASILLMFFIDSSAQRHVFAFLTTVAYYFLHIGLLRLKMYPKDQTAHAIISAAACAALFLFYAGAVGFYLNFDLSLGVLMVAFFGATFLASYQYFFLIAKSPKEALKYSALLSFVMMEIVWAINFWPFGYLTTGVITLIFYYVFWDIIQAFLTEVLTKKKLVHNLLFFGFLVAFVLLTSRWVAVV